VNISAPFIRRPVATTLLTLGALLLGILSYALLPIASLPAVERPTIGVWAILPGASPESVAVSLAQPLERRIGAIPGVTEITSFNDAGYCEITVQFDLGVDLDAAAGAVQAAINAASPDLPKELPQPPRYFKSNPAGFPVIAIALTSDVIAPGEIYDYADGIVAQKLAQIAGVGKVFVSGGERSAVRVEVNPARVANMSLSLEQLRRAIAAASEDLPKGAIALGDQSLTVAANDQLLKAADYRDLVVAIRNGTPIRLADVAAIRDGIVNDKVAAWYGERKAVVLYVVKQPGANIVATVDAVKAVLPELKHWIPQSIKLHVVYDRTSLIRSAVDHVQRTIALALVLVVGVVALFLRRFWATMIPILAIPVALAATLAVMAGLGFGLDVLSLMALTIALSFAVDDAMIMIENVIRRMEAGESAMEAARRGARQIGFTLVSITAALIAALIPVLFMPDLIGRYFREFGLTLVAAITASAIVSLTLTPMMCSRLLERARSDAASTSPFFERAFAAFTRFYLRSLDGVLCHRALAWSAMALVLAGTIGLYMALPKGFMPSQDTGVLAVRTYTISNISFAAMSDLQRRAAAVILADPAVEGLASYIGSGNGQVLSNGHMWVNLKPPEQRGVSIKQVAERLRRRLAGVNNLHVTVRPSSDLSFGIALGGGQYDYTLSGNDGDQLIRWGEIMRRRLAAMPELADVVGDWETDGLEAGLRFDRVQAASMGVTPKAIDNTLYDAFGQRQIRTIYLPSNFSRVVLEVDPQLRADPTGFDKIFVPGTAGAPVPLSAVAQPYRAHAAMWVRHLDRMPTVTISFETRPGVAIGEALAVIHAAEREEHLPAEIKARFSGEAAEAWRSAGREALLFLGAIAAIYIVLGILYESWAHPLTVLSTLPSAVCGALLALLLTGMEFDLLTSIAFMLLIGMVMKNAILMVDFALDAERHHGSVPALAIREAARLRLRPILMTSAATVMTALPLALGHDPGFELRRPLGIAIAGGLLVSQLMTLYTTPLFYLAIDRLRARGRGVR
jgi:hydrophobe/amphiphile efflux-1 (HAE1) family protein